MVLRRLLSVSSRPVRGAWTNNGSSFGKQLPSATSRAPGHAGYLDRQDPTPPRASRAQVPNPVRRRRPTPAPGSEKGGDEAMAASPAQRTGENGRSDRSGPSDQSDQAPPRLDD